MQQDTRAEGLTVIEGGKTAANGIDLADKTALAVGSKAWASKVRRRAKELTQMLDLGYMELARILYQVYDTPVEGDSRRAPVYTAWGYESFKDYAEKELALHGKKAERLRLIWFVLEVQLKDMSQEQKQRIVNLGYSKVRELIRVLSVRNSEMWIKSAETMTYRQLYAAVIDEKRRQGVEEAVLGAGEGGERDETSAAEDAAVVPEQEPVEKLQQERFDLFPLQLANVRLALQRSGELSGSNKKGHQLDLICTDFLATNDIMGGDMDKRLRYVAKLERTLGLRLIAVDPEAKDIVYGIDALKLVADQ